MVQNQLTFTLYWHPPKLWRGKRTWFYRFSHIGMWGISFRVLWLGFDVQLGVVFRGRHHSEGKGCCMKVFTSTTVRQEVFLDADAVETVFKAQLDALCGGKDVYLNEKTGFIEEWEDTGHGSGLTSVVDKKPTALLLAALKLRSLLAEEKRAAYREAERRSRRTA
jgi:hypothetical protein